MIDKLICDLPDELFDRIKLRFHLPSHFIETRITIAITRTRTTAPIISRGPWPSKKPGSVSLIAHPPRREELQQVKPL